VVGRASEAVGGLAAPSLRIVKEATMTTARGPTLTAEGELDVARMRRDRLARLQAEMEAQGVDGLVLSGQGNVHYATGAATLTSEIGRAIHEPVIALVTRDGLPYLCTPYPEGAPPELPADHVLPPLQPEWADGVAEMAGLLADLLAPGAARLAVDDLSAAAYERLPALLPGVELVDAGAVVGPAKVRKTDDELECIRRAQRTNELAMYDVYEALRPGVRQCDLSAIFLRRIFELGAHANVIDPIWQATPPSIAQGPWTVHGDVAFPTSPSDRILRDGDLVLVDSGILYEGYASDFGRTWITGRRRAGARQRDHFLRWCDVIERVLELVRPGTTGLELNRAARKGEPDKPWLDHFYLAHGIGVESAEMPFIGTDLGEDFDEAIVLAPGMVLVLEPVIWEDGQGGFRAEEIVAVTDDGYRLLSRFPYHPFDEGSGPFDDGSGPW